MYLSRGGQLQEAEVELTATASVDPKPCSHGRALPFFSSTSQRAIREWQLKRGTAYVHITKRRHHETRTFLVQCSLNFAPPAWQKPEAAEHGSPPYFVQQARQSLKAWRHKLLPHRMQMKVIFQTCHSLPSTPKVPCKGVISEHKSKTIESELVSGNQFIFKEQALALFFYFDTMHNMSPLKNTARLWILRGTEIYIPYLKRKKRKRKKRDFLLYFSERPLQCPVG